MLWEAALVPTRTEGICCLCRPFVWRGSVFPPLTHPGVIPCQSWESSEKLHGFLSEGAWPLTSQPRPLG